MHLLPTFPLPPYQTTNYGQYGGTLNGTRGLFLSDYVQFRYSGKPITSDCLRSANKLACHLNEMAFVKPWTEQKNYRDEIIAA